MHYSKAPLTEAVIDIQVEALEFDVAKLKALGDGFPWFGETKTINKFPQMVQFSMQPSPSTSASSSSSVLGYMFWSEDKTKAWQARLNGFTISHLRPYQSWEELVAQARPTWEKYRATVNPTITRLAVRYVNRFDIPITDRMDFADYFRTVPKIAPEMDTGLAGFLMSLILPQPDIGAMLMLNQAQVAPTKENTTALILDIDIYREKNIPQDEEAIWDLFSNLRNRKNTIFETCITDVARELIR